MGAANADAAIGDVVLVVVPWDGHKELLESLAPALAGKVVVDCINPLDFDKHGAYALVVEEGSATSRRPQSSPSPGWSVPSTTCPRLDRDRRTRPGRRPRGDRPRPGACRRGARHAWRLRRAAAQRSEVEALTANLISINRRYKAHAGVWVMDV